MCLAASTRSTTLKNACWLEEFIGPGDGELLGAWRLREPRFQVLLKLGEGRYLKERVRRRVLQRQDGHIGNTVGKSARCVADPAWLGLLDRRERFRDRRLNLCGAVGLDPGSNHEHVHVISFAFVRGCRVAASSSVRHPA